MSERALRDEIETLHAAILEERAKLAAPIDVELSQTRTALQAEVETLTARVQALVAQREALETRTKLRRHEAKEARAQLAEARSEIGRREPIGNPLEESRSNWEPPGGAGCTVGLLLLLSGVTTWWLS